jgi:hypothetical protein
MILAASESAIGPTLAVIVGVGMAAQWLAWRSQIPSIILLLVAGLVLGPVTGVVDPDACSSPLARVFENQLGFNCRNDPVPTQGTVIGLAAPSVQKELDGVNVAGK